MADNGLLNAPDDPKAARAKLKADRKEYKKALKEQKKAQREKELEFAARTEEINGDNAGGLATLVITLLIILIWLFIMALLVKLDVGGFGSDILAPIIKDVPYLNLILPEGSYEKKKETVLNMLKSLDSNVLGDLISSIENEDYPEENLDKVYKISYETIEEYHDKKEEEKRSALTDRLSKLHEMSEASKVEDEKEAGDILDSIEKIDF